MASNQKVLLRLSIFFLLFKWIHIGCTHQHTSPQSSEFVGARSNLFYNLSSSKSLRTHIIIVSSFLGRKTERFKR